MSDRAGSCRVPRDTSPRFFIAVGHTYEASQKYRAGRAEQFLRKGNEMASMVEHVTVTAPDISCAHCVATIKEAVGGLSGVSSVQADPDTKRVDIDYDPGQVSLAQIEEVLDEAGYPVAK